MPARLKRTASTGPLCPLRLATFSDGSRAAAAAGASSGGAGPYIAGRPHAGALPRPRETPPGLAVIGQRLLARWRGGGGGGFHGLRAVGRTAHPGRKQEKPRLLPGSGQWRGSKSQLSIVPTDCHTRCVLCWATVPPREITVT